MTVKFHAHGKFDGSNVIAQITDLSTFINASPDEEVCVYYYNDDNEETYCVSKKSVEWLSVEPIW